jgi:hypothetical protein
MNVIAKKVYNTKPTAKQKMAVENTCKNLRTGETLENALLKAKYSPSVAKHPQIVLESKGFRQLADEVGLTDNMILTAIADDIKNKPMDRSKELAIACKVKGLYKADNDQRVTPIDIPDADFIEIIRAYKVRDKRIDKP